MPRKKRNPILTQRVRHDSANIKVRLDARTIVTLANIRALEFWKHRYPNAKVL